MDPILFAFTICLMLSFLLSEFFYSYRYPKVIGQILAGMILGFPFIKNLIFSNEFSNIVSTLSEIGIIFLMLLVGLEVSLKRMRKASKKALIFSILGFCIPLLIGVAGMGLIGYSLFVSFVIGIVLAISAEAVAVEILMEYGYLDTEVGTIIVEAGMIDDILGVLFLSVLLAFIEGGYTAIAKMPFELIIFLFASYIVGFKIYPRLARYIWRDKSEEGIFAISMIFGMTLVLFSEFTGLSNLVGAFLAGLIIHISIKDKHEEAEIIDGFKTITFGMILPFFFIAIGLNFDYSAINLSMVYLIFWVTLLAVIGKVGASLLAGSLVGMKTSDSAIIGWSMNSRGMVGLVVAEIARSNNFLSLELFTVVVIMTILTTILSPIILRKYLIKN